MFEHNWPTSKPFTQSDIRMFWVLGLHFFSVEAFVYYSRNYDEHYLPYLLEYKSHSCISRTPTLELKIGTKLF